MSDWTVFDANDPTTHPNREVIVFRNLTNQFELMTFGGFDDAKGGPEPMWYVHGDFHDGIEPDETIHWTPLPDPPGW